MTALRATYRLQLHAGFTFADARAIVPYLDALGISHLYASPITMAVPGSNHGYDVIDPTRINPELGGEDELDALVAALKSRGMGLIIDIVPNHMGVAGDANAWWLDVLAKGAASEHAATFDIDWTGPLILPVLGAPIEAVLAAGDLKLVRSGESLGLRLYDQATYPLRPDDPVLGEDHQAAVARHDPASEQGRAGLRAIVDRQNYRLTYWRAANDALNWRRFFSINDLAGVRAEDRAVFDRTHALYLDLYRRGMIDGVRVDHVDGLADPGAYCRRLRASLVAADPGRKSYVVIEKILAPGEIIPADWQVDGSSGYDFMREVTALLHDPAGVEPLRSLWAELSGRPADFASEALAGRRDVLAWQFGGQLDACVTAFAALAASAGLAWITAGMLRRAIERLLWIFPVYRTYGGGEAGPPPGDVAALSQARSAFGSLTPPGEDEIVEQILAWLAGCGEGCPSLRREASRRFEQLAAPISAKGVEDTAFYRHGALLSANDVGFDPAQMADSIAGFHAAMAKRAVRYPNAMLATGTHDHKRGEDARARLAVLSSVPDQWRAEVGDWFAIAEPWAADIARDDLYMLLQTLVGAWEADASNLLERVQDWQRKALREAKLRSSWEKPDEDYEERFLALSAGLLGSSAFRQRIQAFQAALAPAAEANTVAQTVLHYLTPGVPDLYQGAELGDYSMVDPDNRRPVDFARAYGDLAQSAGKIAIIAELLALRRARPDLFTGGYEPHAVRGSRAGHVLAFSRTGSSKLHCAVAIRMGSILFGTGGAGVDPGWWGDTVISVGGEDYSVAQLFAKRLFSVCVA